MILLLLLALVSVPALVIGSLAAMVTGNHYDWPYTLIGWGGTTTLAVLLFASLVTF